MNSTFEFLERNKAQPAARTVHRIGIVLNNGFALSSAAKIIEAFDAANKLKYSEEIGQIQYDVCLLSADGGRIVSSCSVILWTERIETYRHMSNIHALFVVAGSEVSDALRDDRLIAWLRCAYVNCRHVFPLDGGRRLLEGAGLAPSTTARDFRSPTNINRALRNPTDSLDALTAALAVVTEDLGENSARQTTDCKAPISPTHPRAIMGKNITTGVSERIREAARWIETHSAQPISIGDAAHAAAMSERNFLRRFKTEIGVPPSDYLLYVRLDTCCRLLIDTDLPIDKIARRCGLADGGRLSRLLRKQLATTPTEYREQNRPATRHVKNAQMKAPPPYQERPASGSLRSTHLLS